MKQNKTFFLLLLTISLLALAGCGGKKTEEYKKDLESVASSMLENAAKAETMLNQYAAVWSHSIESKGAISIEDMAVVTGLETRDIEEYFTLNSIGYIPDDFSTNIHSLNRYYEGSGQLEEVEGKSKEIKNKVSELNDPPKDFEKVYEEVLDMYNLSEEYIDMAINPSGSLQSFNEDRKRLSNDILSKYKRIEVIMPNKD